MPSFRSDTNQILHKARQKIKRGKSKHGLSKEDRNFIASNATAEKYIGNVKRLAVWLRSQRLTIEDANQELVTAYLEENSTKWVQKTMDGYTKAIQMICEIDAPKILSRKLTVTKYPAYSVEQALYLSRTANPQLSLAIRLALCSGLRAHELDTIGRLEDLNESERRWDPNRFVGRESYKTYVVHGKGGLRRTVKLTAELASELEAFRLAAPMKKRQRKIDYVKYYDILGGQAFSQSFCRHSKKMFGWSSGAHGLRHRFAKERIFELIKLGYAYEQALKILSQELGHFAIKNTKAYLR